MGRPGASGVRTPGDLLGEQGHRRGARARDDDVGRRPARPRGAPARSAGTAADRGGQRGPRAVRVAVEHDDNSPNPARRCSDATGQRAQRSGADDQRGARRPGSGPRVAARQLEARRPSAPSQASSRSPVSACTRLPTRSACCTSSLSDRPTAGPALLRRAQRVADLTEDLGLADHHGVQPAHDLEQVLDRGVLVVAQVRVGPARRAGTPAVAASSGGELADPGVERGARRRTPRGRR